MLAAGEGRRLGLGPKAHVVLGGETLLARVVRTCREAGLDRIWVVGSPTDAKMQAACTTLATRLVVNPEPELGMTSSVHVGLRAAQTDLVGGVLVFPVDHPLIRAGTLTSLIAALREDACVRPLRAGRHGHPILLGAAILPRLLALGPETPLRDSLQTIGAHGIDVPCDDDATLDGVNTPTELRRCLASLTRPR